MPLPSIRLRLTQAVGRNRFGEPNFLIAWGQTQHLSGRRGVWPKPHGDGHFGYRPLMLSNSSPSGKGTPCWMILEWKPPEDYETDAVYYFRNRDDVTGMQILGEYPYRGRYEIARSNPTLDRLPATAGCKWRITISTA